MRAFHAPGGPGELLARTSFLEPLVAGRRVLELGAAGATGGASARALAERGAASVLACDEDAEGLARAAATSPHPAIEWRALAPGELPDGPFDLVLVHDGAPLAAAPERVAALAARLAEGGHLVAALPVAGAPVLAAIEGARGLAEAPAYESFVGSLEAVFPSVEVATQSAAVGWALAAASDPEPELSVDGAFGEAPEAAAYLAVCGAEPAGLRGMVLVTLPAAGALRGAASRATVDVEAIRAEAAAAKADALAAAGRADDLERRGRAAADDAAREVIAARAAGQRAAAEEAAAAELRARVAELEASLASARSDEAERTRERDEARRESYARARETRAWADAQGKLEQRIVELETLIASQAREVEIAHGEAARAIADASEARARAEEARYEADAAERRADGAEAELRRLAKDLADGRGELDRARAALEKARDRAAEGGER